jgi:hypothetical protein
VQLVPKIRNAPCIQSVFSIHRTIADLQQRQMNPESRTMLPKMAFTGFASRYREPTLDEGFEDITKVNFKVRSLVPSFLERVRCWGWRAYGAPLRLRAVVVSMGRTSTDVLLLHSLMGRQRRRPNGASFGYPEQDGPLRAKGENEDERE